MQDVRPRCRPPTLLARADEVDRMRRRAMIGLLGWAAAGHLAHAQAPARLVRVGILMDGPLPALHAFKNRLEQLGYSKGRNVEFMERWSDARPDQATRFAAELVAEKP